MYRLSKSGTDWNLPLPRGCAVLIAVPCLWLAIALSPASVNAQAVMGQLVDSDTESPLEGAMVTLVDSTGQTVASTLTNGSGRFLLEALRPGAHHLRAERIGFATQDSERFQLTAGDTLTYRMRTSFEPIALSGISVRGEQRCEINPEAGRATARVWDEARKALEAAAWTKEERGYQYRIISFERVLSPDAREVWNEDQKRLAGRARNPIVSRPANELIENGFARKVATREWEYYAPDAEVLLSDVFLDTHCMALRPRTDEKPNQLGLRFDPVEGRRTPDIAGTMWLDERTSELRSIEYRYANLESRLEVDLTNEVGGELVFHGLPNGSWVIREWWIRMPAIEQQARPGEYVEVPTVLALHEVGGLVSRVSEPAGDAVFSADMAIVTGTVFDSTGVAPLSGARVRVIGTDATAHTGDDGRFRIDGLQDGTYRISYSHPNLESVGYSPDPKSIDLQRGQTVSIHFKAPSRAEALALSCQQRWGRQLPEDMTVGAVMGYVREQDTSAPVAGAQVDVLWSEWDFRAKVEENLTTGESGVKTFRIDENRWGAQVQAGENGFYSVCGVPTQQPIKVAASWGPVSGDTVGTEIDRSFVQTDLTLPVSATGEVVGRVLDFESGAPLAGARVSLLDDSSSVEAVTDGSGRFVATGVPFGPHPVAVSYGEWSGVTDTVTVSTTRPVGLKVRVPTRAIEIEGITVEVLSTDELDFRSRGRAEDYVAGEELATIRQKAHDVAGVLREMGSPRIRVMETSGDAGASLCVRHGRPSGRAVSANRCNPMLIVLDGQILQDVSGTGLNQAILLDLEPGDIESVRVLSPMEGRFRFGSRGEAGVIIIETREGRR